MNALVNHLWQSTAFAAAAAVLALALRRHRAGTRHWIWMAASLKFLAPFALLTVFGTQVGTHAPLPAVAGSHFAAQVDSMMEWTMPPALPARSNPLPAAALILWAAGALFLAARWTRAWLGVRALVRRAAPLPLPFPIPVRSTAAGIEPGIFGIFRPVLLLPAGIADRLSPAQFQAILAHEAAHVRRRDNLWSALHMLVATIFWFHPLVWFIGARLTDERERACDEDVLRLGNQPEAYAESILAACKLYIESPLPCVAGVTGADLRKRIERIMTDRIGWNLRLHTKLAIAAVVALAIGLPIVAGLLRAQTQGEQPQFDVASIRLAKPSAGPLRVSWNTTPGKITFSNVTVKACIRRAYGVKTYQVSGGPDWAGSERFDITAKAAHPVAEGQLMLMLQALLADRFKLALHRESVEIPIYALVVAKNGPKLQEAKGDDTEIGAIPGRYRGVTMSLLASSLARDLDRPIQDMTGLPGKFDFTLNYTPDQLAAPTEPDNSAPPSLFTALQEQLGLKLEARKSLVEHLVIDHVERPSGN